MTTRKIGAIVRSLCILTAVMTCSSWTLPPSEDVVARPRDPVGPPATSRSAIRPTYSLA